MARKPRRPKAYASSLMVERRQRLIDTAKELIADQGADNFTIRELTRRSSISVTTVYSAFGDKEGVIAAAIENFYGQLPVSQRRAPSNLKSLLGTMSTTSKTILSNTSYSHSIADLYFSRTANGKVHGLLQQLAINIYEPWIRKTAENGDLIPNADIKTLCDFLATKRWGTIFEWAAGRIPDKQLATSLKFSFLVLAIGITTGQSRSEAEKELEIIIPRKQ